MQPVDFGTKKLHLTKPISPSNTQSYTSDTTSYDLERITLLPRWQRRSYRSHTHKGHNTAKQEAGGYRQRIQHHQESPGMQCNVHAAAAGHIADAKLRAGKHCQESRVLPIGSGRTKLAHHPMCTGCKSPSTTRLRRVAAAHSSQVTGDRCACVACAVLRRCVVPKGRLSAPHIARCRCCCRLAMAWVCRAIASALQANPCLTRFDGISATFGQWAAPPRLSRAK